MLCLVLTHLFSLKYGWKYFFFGRKKRDYSYNSTESDYTPTPTPWYAHIYICHYIDISKAKIYFNLIRKYY